MNHRAAELEAAAARWRALGRPVPDVALVAGSGLAVDLGAARVGPEPLADWVPFPVGSVAGHGHELELFETPAGRRVLYFRGRIHGYQGYDAAEVVFPVRLAARLGARVLVMTNAAGGVRPEWPAGTLAAVTDQLNLTGSNPLAGEPPAGWGPRFPDMLDAYDPALRALAHEHARRLGFELAEGVYAGLPGPSYETPAEIRFFRKAGADAVGMSTVPEAIAARHMGVEVLGLSCITNMAAGVLPAPLEHAEVMETARRVRSAFTALLDGIIERM